MRCVILPVLVAANWGILKLDNYTFPMLVGKQTPAFVRFDREYPYGDKAEAFNSVAAEIAKSRAGCLMVSIGVSTWGDRMNNDIVVDQGLVEADHELSYDDMDKLFPKFRFFPGSGGKPIDYADEVTAEGFMKFLRNTAGIEFVMPGCLKAMDVIAASYKKDPAAALEKAKAAAADLNEFDSEKAAYYIKVLEKEVAKPGHVEKEKARLENMLKSGTLPAKNKDVMTLKVNVLASFEGL
jgi:hypothetical protein